MIAVFVFGVWLLASALATLVLTLIVWLIVRKKTKKFMLNTILGTVILGFFGTLTAPFIYWTMKYNDFNTARLKLCREETAAEFFSEPPRENVVLVNREKLSSYGTTSTTIWRQIAELELQSVVAHVADEERSLTGGKGWFLLGLENNDSENCRDFNNYVNQKQLKTRYLKGQCVVASPVDESKLIDVTYFEIKTRGRTVYNKPPYGLSIHISQLINQFTGEVYGESSHLMTSSIDSLKVLFTIKNNSETCSQQENLRPVVSSDYGLFRFVFNEGFRKSLIVAESDDNNYNKGAGGI